MKLMYDNYSNFLWVGFTVYELLFFFIEVLRVPLEHWDEQLYSLSFSEVGYQYQLPIVKSKADRRQVNLMLKVNELGSAHFLLLILIEQVVNGWNVALKQELPGEFVRKGYRIWVVPLSEKPLQHVNGVLALSTQAVHECDVVVDQLDLWLEKACLRSVPVDAQLDHCPQNLALERRWKEHLVVAQHLSLDAFVLESDQQLRVHIYDDIFFQKQGNVKCYLF